MVKHSLPVNSGGGGAELEVLQGSKNQCKLPLSFTLASVQG